MPGFSYYNRFEKTIAMKKLKSFLAPLFILTAFCSYAQQEFTLNTTPANLYATKALIDLPGLTGNPDAIIIAIPLGNTKTANPHPIGAWYYSGKWYVFNSDHAVMNTGLSFKVQYTASSGPDQFLHLVTQQNLGAEGTYIDNPALNNKPNAQFAIFQNHSPEIRMGSWLNQHEAKTGYSTTSGKWFITNINGQPLQKGAAYNIMIYQGGGTVIIENPGPIKTVPPTTTSDCKCPASLPPNGQATGDLLGMYPNPVVGKILGRSLSMAAPQTGQVLKWNGNEWSPSNDATFTPAAGSTGTEYIAGTGIAINGNELSAQNNEAIWNAFRLRGNVIAQTAPKTGQVLTFSGNSWYPANAAATFTTGIGLKLEESQLSALNTNPIWNASQLVGREIMTTAPTVGQVLKWGGGSWYPANETGISASTIYNNTVMLTGTSMFTLNPPGSGDYTLPGMLYIFNLTTAAKFLVSFNIPSVTQQCFGCGATDVILLLYVNGVVQQRFAWDITNGSSLLLSATHLLTLPAGTNKIELKAFATGPSITFGYTATQSTMIIQIIPQ